MVILEQQDLRFSLIFPDVLRIEKGAWTDLPTQTVWYRDFGDVSYTVSQQEKRLIISTAAATFTVSIPGGKILSIALADGTAVANPAKDILPGTARTLDGVTGAVRLEKGIVSESGISVLDDSKSLLLAENGDILPRPKCSDRYYFACGRDPMAQLRTFYRLTGQVPLIPRFAFGNWWSRYRAYTQEEYRALMQTFIDKKLPITVATIDMDWHWTDVLERFGKEAAPGKAKAKEEVFFNKFMPGWTGYTWNTELFPDHRELLDWLHGQGFKVPLNVHPSQGIRFFEENYVPMCKRMGIDPETKAIVEFDPANPKFMEAYFEEIHHPLEREGVDFWWLDWQQGKVTAIPGLDPLWALNHYHTLDMEKRGKRPLILSRYAGLGSHRYPLGFSGDATVTWASLRFQPYFTNSAASAGYSWWSHDIGGHGHGIQSDELYLRWLQYGVFSPINRLHSTNYEFMGKEPWKRSWAVEKVSEEFLRLRHKLIPYLYAMNYRTHTTGEPLCMPMYYCYDHSQARQVRNQYFFGSQLLVSPIIHPADPRLLMGSVKTWLPEGRWTDIFTDRIYEGGRFVKLHRDMNAIPVLAKAGAIVPMYRNADTNDLSLEQPLEIHLWRGNGSFDLYEDDGESLAYRKGIHAITRFTLEESGNTLTLTVTPPADSHGLLPAQRQMYLRFRDVETEEVCVTVGSEPVVIRLENIRVKANPPKAELRSNLLTRVQAGNRWKNRRLEKNPPKFVKDALEELDTLWYPVE